MRSEDKRFLLGTIAIPLITGALAFAGSLGGIYLGNNMSQRQMDRQKTIEWEERIEEKRLDVINRWVRLIGRTAGAKEFWAKYLKANGAPSVEIVDKLSDYKSEYEALLIEAALYFGPQTKEAIGEIAKEEEGVWWERSLKSENQVTAAMTQELDWHLIYFKADQGLGGKSRESNQSSKP